MGIEGRGPVISTRVQHISEEQGSFEDIIERLKELEQETPTEARTKQTIQDGIKALKGNLKSFCHIDIDKSCITVGDKKHKVEVLSGTKYIPITKNMPSYAEKAQVLWAHRQVFTKGLEEANKKQGWLPTWMGGGKPKTEGTATFEWAQKGAGKTELTNASISVGNYAPTLVGRATQILSLGMKPGAEFEQKTEFATTPQLHKEIEKINAVADQIFTPPEERLKKELTPYILDIIKANQETLLKEPKGDSDPAPALGALHTCAKALSEVPIETDKAVTGDAAHLTRVLTLPRNAAVLAALQTLLAPAFEVFIKKGEGALSLPDAEQIIEDSIKTTLRELDLKVPIQAEQVNTPTLASALAEDALQNTSAPAATPPLEGSRVSSGSLNNLGVWAQEGFTFLKRRVTGQEVPSSAYKEADAAEKAVIAAVRALDEKFNGFTLDSDSLAGYSGIKTAILTKVDEALAASACAAEKAEAYKKDLTPNSLYHQADIATIDRQIAARTKSLGALEARKAAIVKGFYEKVSSLVESTAEAAGALKVPAVDDASDQRDNLALIDKAIEALQVQSEAAQAYKTIPAEGTPAVEAVLSSNQVKIAALEKLQAGIKAASDYKAVGAAITALKAEVDATSAAFRGRIAGLTADSSSQDLTALKDELKVLDTTGLTESLEEAQVKYHGELEEAARAGFTEDLAAKKAILEKVKNAPLEQADAYYSKLTELAEPVSVAAETPLPQDADEAAIAPKLAEIEKAKVFLEAAVEVATVYKGILGVGRLGDEVLARVEAAILANREKISNLDRLKESINAGTAYIKIKREIEPKAQALEVRQQEFQDGIGALKQDSELDALRAAIETLKSKREAIPGSLKEQIELSESLIRQRENSLASLPEGSKEAVSAEIAAAKLDLKHLQNLPTEQARSFYNKLTFLASSVKKLANSPPDEDADEAAIAAKLAEIEKAQLLGQAQFEAATVYKGILEEKREAVPEDVTAVINANTSESSSLEALKVAYDYKKASAGVVAKSEAWNAAKIAFLKVIDEDSRADCKVPLEALKQALQLESNKASAYKETSGLAAELKEAAEANIAANTGKVAQLEMDSTLLDKVLNYGELDEQVSDILAALKAKEPGIATEAGKNAFLDAIPPAIEKETEYLEVLRAYKTLANGLKDKDVGRGIAETDRRIGVAEKNLEILKDTREKVLESYYKTAEQLANAEEASIPALKAAYDGAGDKEVSKGAYLAKMTSAKEALQAQLKAAQEWDADLGDKDKPEALTAALRDIPEKIRDLQEEINTLPK